MRKNEGGNTKKRRESRNLSIKGNPRGFTRSKRRYREGVIYRKIKGASRKFHHALTFENSFKGLNCEKNGRMKRTPGFFHKTQSINIKKVLDLVFGGGCRKKKTIN